MKFRTIFILFNIVLIFSFIFILAMPFIVLGIEYTADFWSRNWPLATLFLGILAAFNLFFAGNWRLLSALEREDWSAVTRILEDKVYRLHRHDRRTIRLLLNTALLQGDVNGIEKLETELATRSPAALKRDALLFGAARLLRNDPATCETFLSQYLNAKGVDNHSWLVFYHAFALVMQNRSSEAAAPLNALLHAKDPVLALLAAYLNRALVAPVVDTETSGSGISDAEAVRHDLAIRFDKQRWSRETERAKGEMHIVILSKILDDASSWLFEVRQDDCGPA